MKENTVRNIKLEWKYTGPCPDQWYSYFYNEYNDKTYCAYIRQDTCGWSAALRNTDGCYTSEEFENQSSEVVEWENIYLAFDYLSYVVYPFNVIEEAYFRRVVEEVLIYLNHRFPYFHFCSQVRDNFDFMDEIVEGDEHFRMEVLSRRAQLMRRYLAEYEKFLDSMPE